MTGDSGIEVLSFRPNLPVRDLAVSIAFYQDMLGLEVQHSDQTFALLRAPSGGELAIVLHPSPQPSGGYLYVRGVEVLHQRFLDSGLQIQRTLQLQPWGLLDFVVADPDGHPVGVGEWRNAPA